MPTNSARKRQATELARATGINYTTALRVLEFQAAQAANPAPALVSDPTKVTTTNPDALIVWDRPAPDNDQVFIARLTEKGQALVNDPEALTAALRTDWPVFTMGEIDLARGEIRMNRKPLPDGRPGATRKTAPVRSQLVALDPKEVSMGYEALAALLEERYPQFRVSHFYEGRNRARMVAKSPDLANPDPAFQVVSGVNPIPSVGDTIVLPHLNLSDKIIVRLTEGDEGLDIGDLRIKLSAEHPGYVIDQVVTARGEVQMVKAVPDATGERIDVTVPAHTKADLTHEETLAWLEQEYPGYVVEVPGPGYGQYTLVRKPETGERSFSVTLTEEIAALEPARLIAALEEQHPGFYVDVLDLEKGRVQMGNRSFNRVFLVPSRMRSLTPAQMKARVERLFPGWRAKKVDGANKPALLVSNPTSQPGTPASFTVIARTETMNGSLHLIYSRLEEQHPGYMVGEYMGGNRFLMVAKPQFPDKVPFDLDSARKMDLPSFGVDQDGKILTLGIGEGLLVTGESDVERSMVTNSLVDSALLMSTYATYVLDAIHPRLHSLVIPDLTGYAHNFDEAWDHVHEIYGEMRYRQQLLTENGARHCEELPTDLRPRPILLVVNSTDWLAGSADVAESEREQLIYHLRKLITDGSIYDISVVYNHPSGAKLPYMRADDLAGMSRLLVGPADNGLLMSVFRGRQPILPSHTGDGGRGLLQRTGTVEVDMVQVWHPAS